MEERRKGLCHPLYVEAEGRGIVVLQAQGFLGSLHAGLLHQACPEVMLLEAEVQSRLMPHACAHIDFVLGYKPLYEFPNLAVTFALSAQTLRVQCRVYSASACWTR